MSLLGVDVGTSGCKALAIDLDGRVLASASRTYKRSTPQPGRCEIEPEELLAAVEAVIADVRDQVQGDPVQAMAFSVFGGSFVALDADHKPLSNLISTTDTRAAQDVEAWKRDFGARRTYDIAGLIPHTSFLLMKVLAFRRMCPDLFARAQVLASAEELIHARLGLPPACDSATASTYMACDLAKGDWSGEILAAAGIDRALMPAIVDSGTVIGEVGGVMVVAGGHDQQVASFGAGLTRPGAATDSLGTVEAISTLTSRPRLDDRAFANNLPAWKHVHGGLFFSIVYNFSCADLLNWAMRAFYGAEPGGELGPLKAALDALPDQPARSLVLPHFCGSGTPHMDPGSRGAIVGLDLSMGRDEIVRAIVDSQNYEMRLNLDIWRDGGVEIDRLRVYGGLAQSDRLLQTKADVLGVEVIRLECPEAGCFGAAVLAGVGTGLIPDAEAFLHEHVRELRAFEPRREYEQRRAQLYEIYRGLYAAVSETSHRLTEVNA